MRNCEDNPRSENTENPLETQVDPRTIVWDSLYKCKSGALPHLSAFKSQVATCLPLPEVGAGSLSGGPCQPCANSSALRRSATQRWENIEWVGFSKGEENGGKNYLELCQSLIKLTGWLLIKDQQ